MTDNKSPSNHFVSSLFWLARAKWSFSLFVVSLSKFETNWSFRKNVYQYNGCSKYILIKKNLINWIPSKIFFFFKKYLWLFSLWSSINHAPFPRNEIRIEITYFSLSFSRIKEETIETIGTKAWLCIDVGSMTAQVSPGKLIYSRWWISITPLLAWFHARNSICHAVSTHTCLYIYIYIHLSALSRRKLGFSNRSLEGGKGGFWVT